MLPFQGAEDTVKRFRTGEYAFRMQGDHGGVSNLEVGFASKRVEIRCSDQGFLDVSLGGAAVESYSRRAKVGELDLVQHRLLVRIEDLGTTPEYACSVEMEGACGFEQFLGLVIGVFGKNCHRFKGAEKFYVRKDRKAFLFLFLFFFGEGGGEGLFEAT